MFLPQKEENSFDYLLNLNKDNLFFVPIYIDYFGHWKIDH